MCTSEKTMKTKVSFWDQQPNFFMISCHKAVFPVWVTLTCPSIKHQHKCYCNILYIVTPLWQSIKSILYHSLFNFSILFHDSQSILPCLLPSHRLLSFSCLHCYQVGNHDKPRIASSAGQTYIRVINMLLLTLPGTPTTYYGEEIGMENINVTESQIQDPAGKYNAVSCKTFKYSLKQLSQMQ